VFQEAFDRNAPALFRYLRRLTGSRQQAEDLTQETFLKLHVQLTDGTTPDNVRAWLFRVATNLALDRQKSQIRSLVRELAHAPAALPVDFRTHVEQRQQVSRALARLTPRMRQVLLLHAEGFRYREIAEIAGIEVGYVGVLLQRARAEFRKIYEEIDGQTRGFPTQRRLR
jgi:RNA polymerase sigma-70 factor (ECF subfamily)